MSETENVRLRWSKERAGLYFATDATKRYKLESSKFRAGSARWLLQVWDWPLIDGRRALDHATAATRAELVAVARAFSALGDGYGSHQSRMTEAIRVAYDSGDGQQEPQIQPDQVIGYDTYSHRTLLYHVSSVTGIRTTAGGNAYAVIRACRVVRRNGAFRLASRCDYKSRVLLIKNVAVVASGVTIDSLLSAP